MEIPECRSKSFVSGEPHLNHMIKLNANSGLTVLIYVKRFILYLAKSFPCAVHLFSLCHGMIALHTAGILVVLILR